MMRHRHLYREEGDDAPMLDEVRSILEGRRPILTRLSPHNGEAESVTTFVQMPLAGFNAPSAKVIAIGQAESHADSHWLASARAEVDFLAKVRDAFTTDDVWQRLDNHDTPPPREPRAMGAVMRRAAADRVIEASGVYQQSEREINHNRPVMVWRSLVR